MDIVFSQDPRDFPGVTGRGSSTADPAGTVFHTPAFLKLYWEEFADLPDHLLLAFAEEDDGSRSARSRSNASDGTLRFLGGTEVTDYMGPVALPEARRTRREGAVRGAARTRRLDRGRSARPPRGPAVAGPAHRGGCRARVRDRGARRPERRRAVPAAPGIVRGVPRTPAGEAPSRDQAQGAVAWRPRSARGTSAGHPRDAGAVPGPVRGAPSHERGAQGRLHAARGWRSSSAGSVRRSCPTGIFRLDLHRGRRSTEARGLDRLPVRGHVALYNSAFDRTCGTRVARDGAGGRGHPHRDRGRVLRVRHAEGRLRVQVPVRRRTRERSSGWSSRAEAPYSTNARRTSSTMIASASSPPTTRSPLSR